MPPRRRIVLQLITTVSKVEVALGGQSVVFGEGHLLEFTSGSLIVTQLVQRVTHIQMQRL